MSEHIHKSMHNRNRINSIIAFSCLFAYLLSFVFEGQVLYSIIDAYGAQTYTYILSAIIAHFVGLFSCGHFIKTPRMARLTMAGGMMVCLLFTLPYFFAPSLLWLIGLVISGYVGGCAVAAWGFYLKAFTPKNERIKSCADVLIYSNIIMILINVVAINFTPFLGLCLSLLCLIIGAVCTWLLPVDKMTVIKDKKEKKLPNNLKKPMIILFLFVSIITINSGLMYQVINPAFEHLTILVSWYWAVPYIIALVIMRNLPLKVKRSRILYVGMAMIIGAFISFMMLERKPFDYLIVDTLMLGVCGVFDLFWWSIIGEMLDYTENPVKVFGIGLSANVFGVLSGDVLGVGITSIALSVSEVAVIALSVVFLTLIILTPLNQQLILLLKSHTYLTTYSVMSAQQQSAIIQSTKPLDPLTARENEVLQHILSGESNKEISASLNITENTVKTHARNIFSKYDVSSRAELISTLLKNQSGI